jgi:hypothetical protein
MKKAQARFYDFTILRGVKLADGRVCGMQGPGVGLPFAFARAFDLRSKAG